MNAFSTHISVMADQLGIAEATPRGRMSLREIATGLAVTSMVAAAICYGQHYWMIGRFLQTTDDAYVQADFTTIAPRISGYIRNVLVDDNVAVKAGQVLARIDDRDFQTALAQAEANVAASDAAIHNIDAQLQLQASVIEQARAEIGAANAAVKFAQEDHVRYQGLMKTGFGTIQRAQQAETTLTTANESLRDRQAGLNAARQKIAVLETERENAVAERERDVALRAQAQLNLSYTVIRAPVDGTVGARSLRVGQYVQAGTQLMAVVPLHAAYVVANFKETQLTHVDPGQAVDISADAFPGIRFKGHVDSVAPASGLEFALLPPDNATGNFTKIVQRLPVKVVIDDQTLSGRLRAGMSVEATIDTRGIGQPLMSSRDTGARGTDS